MTVSSSPVTVEAVSYSHGHWCRTCWLSSGVQGVLMFTSPAGASLRTFHRCEECGGDQIDPVAQP